MFLNADAPGASADSLTFEKGVYAEETESLQRFFARVLQLYTIDLTTLTSNVPVGRPALLDYLNTASVKRKWINYHLLKADLVLDIQVLSNAYAYGQIIIAINYSDWIAEIPNTSVSDLGRYHQCTKEHVILDIGMSNTATLRIPWNQPLPFWDLQLLPSTINYPVIEISTMYSLIRADTGGVAVGNLIVNAHLENVSIAIPTPAVNVSERSRLKRRDTPFAHDVAVHNESKEATGKGFMSGPLSAVSDATRMLKNVPFIGQSASAVSEVSNGLSKAAAIFGWSRPRDLAPSTTIGFNDESCSTALDQFKSLTLDPNAAVTPSLSNSDNLSFQATICRPGIVAAFPYNQSYLSGDIINSYPVHPGLVWRNSTDFKYPLSPLAYYSFPFRMWRGTIDVRIDFVASRFHRGRVRIIYTPYKLTTANVPADVSLTSFNMVVDISCSTTVEFSIPWMSADPYLPCGLDFIDTDPLLTNSNGFISIQVVDPLQAPSASGAPVYVTTWYKAGKDFELAEHQGQTKVTPWDPRLTEIEKTNVVPWTDLYDDPQDIVPTLGSGASLHPAYVGYVNQSARSTNDAAVDALVKTELGHSVDSANQAITYVGERYSSFRPLTKRFATAMLMPVQSNSANTTVFGLPRMPPTAGVYDKGTGLDPQYVGPYVPCPLTHFSMPFRGTRGSTRIDIIPSPTCSMDRSMTQITFPTTLPIHARQVIHHTDSPVSTYYGAEEFTDLMTSGKAVAQFSSAYQQTSFNIPYQQNGLYEITRYKSGAAAAIKGRYPCAVVVCPWKSTDSVVRVRYAAGEDFNPEVWVGIPPVYTAVLPPQLV